VADLPHVRQAQAIDRGLQATGPAFQATDPAPLGIGQPHLGIGLVFQPAGPGMSILEILSTSTVARSISRSIGDTMPEIDRSVPIGGDVMQPRFPSDVTIIGITILAVIRAVTGGDAPRLSLLPVGSHTAGRAL